MTKERIPLSERKPNCVDVIDTTLVNHTRSGMTISKLSEWYLDVKGL